MAHGQPTIGRDHQQLAISHGRYSHMVTGIIGRKVGMTQIFDADGTVHPATVIKAGPCVVVQSKDAQSDGYEAVQLGFVEETPAKTNKPTAGHFKKANVPATRVRREVGLASGAEKPKVGEQVLASIFATGERVDIVGTGRGKGFQGVVRRHHFAGGAATHGSMFHRAPGSIGASSFPSRVVKGMRAAGRMGGKRITIHNLKVLRVDPENHLLIVEGGIPGAPTSYVIIRKAVTLKKLKVAQVEKPKKGKK
jgi:large subunit ribosomal protein L3